jgi:hypothetical protein
MKKKIILILFIIVAIILSYYTSIYFGQLYNIFPQSKGGAYIGSESAWDSLIGLPLALIFFLILFVYSWSKSWKYALWISLPVFLWEIAMDFKHIYIPILLALVAFTIAKIINFVIYKLKRPNLPMTIK